LGAKQVLAKNIAFCFQSASRLQDPVVAGGGGVIGILTPTCSEEIKQGTTFIIAK
jgi:hypothetical protein